MAISVADNFQYLGTKPLDARLKFASVSDMVSTAAASLYDGCFAYVTATKKYYSYDSTNTVDVTLGKWREYTSGGDTIQVSSMPTASESELGKVYQYIGSTTLVYTHGYFYECVSDGAGTPTYSWEEVSTSKGGHDIKNDGVAVTSRDTMNFTDFDIADDSTNEETDIKAHRLTRAEIADICTPLPGAVSDMPVLLDERETEYVVGWYVLANGTKKPIYQKCIVNTLPTVASEGTNSSKQISIGASVDIGYVYVAYFKSSSNNYNNIMFLNTAMNKLVSATIYPNNGTTFQNVINVNCNSQSYSGANAYFVVRYTKTTDTPV